MGEQDTETERRKRWHLEAAARRGVQGRASRGKGVGAKTWRGGMCHLLGWVMPRIFRDGKRASVARVK